MTSPTNSINGSWQVVASPTSSPLNKIAMASASEGWAVGNGGIILHYINGAWQAVNVPTGPDFFSIAMVSANEGWAFGAGGTILHYH
jgi:photosystem II stability/assembly factor-like uncharacterized protein